MFGIGLPELILIMGLALIVVGPDKLPGLAKTVAKQILELKKAANSLKDSLDEELKEEKETLQELAAPLSEFDVRLPDFEEVDGAKIVRDLADPVAPAVVPEPEEPKTEEPAPAPEEATDSSDEQEQKS